MSCWRAMEADARPGRLERERAGAEEAVWAGAGEGQDLVYLAVNALQVGRRIHEIQPCFSTKCQVQSTLLPEAVLLPKADLCNQTNICFA